MPADGPATPAGSSGKGPPPPDDAPPFRTRSRRCRTRRRRRPSTGPASSRASRRRSSPSRSRWPSGRPPPKRWRPRILARLNPEQQRAVQDHRRPGPHPGRRGQRQDARAGPSCRLPRRRQGRSAVADPGRHLHQQGGGRVARPHHRPGRRGGRPRGRDGHLPRPVRAGPAARRRRHRPGPAFRRLRLGRPGRPDEADPARGGPADHGRVQAERDPGRHLSGQERDARRRLHRRQRPHPPRA